MSGEAHLLVIDPSGHRRRVPLRGRTVTIGRLVTNDIQIADSGVSRRHARIRSEDDGYLVEDLGSTNGTFVDGELLTEPQRLEGNEIVRFGRESAYSVVFRLGPPQERFDDPSTEAMTLWEFERLQSLGTLLEVGKALGSTLQLDDVFAKAMDAALELTGAQRACLLLGDGPDELEMAVDRRQDPESVVEDPALDLEKAAAVFRAREPRITHGADDGSGDPPESVVCVPLILPEQRDAPGSHAVIGVLYVSHRRRSRAFSLGEMSLLESLASQAAAAIDNARMYEEVERSHGAVLEAYETTLEGWARALELRDQETEGHTRRVTELAVELGRRVGMPEEGLVQLRRGALLHDIGKMGVPDEVLLKPGPLDTGEWEQMREHPRLARRWLEPIEFLRPALEVPFCHHERWDGSGYPRGLAAEEIPLAARVFAVVDVWDAMTSDRPYRQALPAEQVLQFLREEAGRSFDPEVVAAFLEMYEEGAVDEVERR